MLTSLLLRHAVEELDGLGVFLQRDVSLLDFGGAAGVTALTLDLAEGAQGVDALNLDAESSFNGLLDLDLVRVDRDFKT